MAYEDKKMKSVWEEQHGGDHYKKHNSTKSFIVWGLKFVEGSIVKYILRFRVKGGADDLKKAIHYTRMLLEEEYGILSRIEYSE